VTGTPPDAPPSADETSARAALRERDELLRLAIEQSAIAIAIVALDGAIEYFNRRAIQLFGYVPSDIPTMTEWWQLAYPDEAYRSEAFAQWMSLVGNAITHGTEIERRDYHITCKDGSRKTVVIFGVIVGGKAFVMFEDVTERERAQEEALRAKENDLAAIAENTHDGIIVTTTEGRPRYANRRATEISGYSVSELLTLDMRRVLLPADPDWISERQRARNAGLPTTNPLEVRIVTKSGAVVPLELSTTPSTWNGAPANLVVVRDITERKRAEEERGKLHTQLAQAQKMEAIGTLAGGVAHDFNNILAGLLGGLTLLDLELGELGEHRSDVPEMIGLVKRGAELARQLLGFARRGKYDVRPLLLAPVLEKTCAMFSRTRKDLTLEIDVAPGLRAVLMDHAQLEQVLLNLFLNAGHAMPDGGRLFLRAENLMLASDEAARHEVAPGAFVKLLVADTGVGMDAATQARIFEPFFTTKAPGQGTGLGLASVYGIVKNHGGFIEVESALGEGATFSLFLPATDAPILSRGTPALGMVRGVGTILVVDDEEYVARVCGRMLEQLGYSVMIAAGGAQAIELVRRHGARISLVMLDLVMPGMSGGQTYDALRALAPSLKILLASGYSLEGQAQEILARGCDGFLQKPFSPGTLSAKLRELL
jgi:PAS domain S-box-containing protein